MNATGPRAVLAAAPVYLLTANWSGHQSNDVLATYLPAWSLAHTGTPTVAPGLVHRVLLAGQLPWLHPAAHAVGQLASDRMPGLILAALPGYLLAPSALPTPAPAVFMAALYAAGTVGVLFALLRQRLGQHAALAATALVAFASPWWSVAASSLWPHAPAGLLLLASLWCLSTGRHGWAGVAAGGLFLCRPPLLLIPLAAAGLDAWRYRRDWGAADPRRALVLAGPVVAVALMLAWSAWMFGHPTLAGGYVIDHQAPGPARATRGAALMLLSPTRGVAVLTPWLLLALPGLRIAWAQVPAWARGATVGAVGVLGFTLWQYGGYGGEGFFGYRYQLEPLLAAAPLLAVAVGATVRCFPVARWIFGVSATWSAVVFAAAAAAYRPHVNPSEWATWSLPLGGFLVTLPIVLTVLVAVFVVWRRRKHHHQVAEQLLVSREDRTADFARQPGRLRGSGLL